MTDGSQRPAAPHRAGISDVRNVIGALIGFYGVVLVIMGIAAESAEDRAKTGDVNANLWAGIGMVLFGVAFVAWAWLRPVIVDPDEIEPPDPQGVDQGFGGETRPPTRPPSP
jgi:hypothetical protein